MPVIPEMFKAPAGQHVSFNGLLNWPRTTTFRAPRLWGLLGVETAGHGQAAEKPKQKPNSARTAGAVAGGSFLKLASCRGSYCTLGQWLQRQGRTAAPAEMAVHD